MIVDGAHHTSSLEAPQPSDLRLIHKLMRTGEMKGDCESSYSRDSTRVKAVVRLVINDYINQ